MTELNIKLIIKVINGSAISILIEDNKVPFGNPSNLHPDIDATIASVAARYNIHEAYVQPKLVTLLVEGTCINAYYTILTPMEFINESTIGKISNNFSKLSEQDRIAIRQAISILPY